MRYKEELNELDEKFLGLVRKTEDPARLGVLVYAFRNNDSVLNAILGKKDSVLVEILKQKAVTRIVRDFIIQNILDVGIIEKISDGKYFQENVGSKDKDLELLSILKNPHVRGASELLVSVFNKIEDSKLRTEILVSLPDEDVRNMLKKYVEEKVSVSSNRNSFVSRASYQDPTAGVVNNDVASDLSVKS